MNALGVHFICNIVPLTMISYLTLLKLSRKQSIGYGQWLCLLLFLAINHFLSIFMVFSIWFILLDFSIKMTLVLLPQKMNQKLQQKVRQIDILSYLSVAKTRFLNYSLDIHWKISEFIINQMQYHQMRDFKIRLISKISKQMEIDKNQKFINLDNEQQIQKKYSYQAKSLLKSKNKVVSEEMISENNYRPMQMKINQNLDQTPKFTNSFRPFHQQKKSIKLQKPTKILKQQFEQFPSRPQKKTILQQMREQQIRNQQMTRIEQSNKFILKNRKNIQHLKRYKDVQTQDINKEINVRGFRCSTIFENNYFDKQQQNLVCRVEAIVEMGSGANQRLQIHYLELYSNSSLKIVSLYGRQIEKKKLISLKLLPNNYYELRLYGKNVNSVNKRRVKFRQSYQPFLNYLSQE